MKLSHFLSFPPFLPFFLELFLTTLLSHTQIWINTSIRMHNIPLHNTVPPWYTILPPQFNLVFHQIFKVPSSPTASSTAMISTKTGSVFKFLLLLLFRGGGRGDREGKSKYTSKMQSWEGANILVSRKAPSLSCWAFVLRTHAIYSNRVNMYYNATNE